ncbi:MAG: response regulator, partial [Persicimonas sp.]
PEPAEPLSGHILLIEDQPLVRKITTKILEEAGLEVTAVAGGGQAIDLVGKRGALAFDLVISDVVMPHMSGQEVVSRLRELGPQLKFLFISGYPDNYSLPRSSELAVDILMKPFTSAKLTETVRSLLDAD